MAISPSQGSTTQPRRMGRRRPVRRGSFQGRSEKAQALPARAAASPPGWHARHLQATPWRGRQPSPTRLRAGWCGLPLSGKVRKAEAWQLKPSGGEQTSRDRVLESPLLRASHPRAHIPNTARGPNASSRFSVWQPALWPTGVHHLRGQSGVHGKSHYDGSSWKGPGPV